MSSGEWIGVDWGTTHLRAYLMQGPDLIEARSSTSGMGGLYQAAFAPALRELCADWMPLPVVACGMVGSRQGWVEAPYVAAPCAPPRLEQAVRAPGDMEVRILPGVSQARPADVMRGEETQVAGLLAARPQFDGVVCLPGTHSKWVQVSAGEIVSFQTFMTGEVFALLSRQSVLRHTVAEQGWDADVFLDALADALSHPASIAARLFGLRAGGLLEEITPVAARARLSGFLIGLELGGARPYWMGQEVVVLGAPEIAQHYEVALEGQGVQVTLADAQAATRAGLWVARKAT